MSAETCPSCNGTGNDERDEGFDSKKYPCGDCNGTGAAPAHPAGDAIRGAEVLRDLLARYVAADEYVRGAGESQSSLYRDAIRALRGRAG